MVVESGMPEIARADQQRSPQTEFLVTDDESDSLCFAVSTGGAECPG
jgi:hypothetical protein